MRNRTRSLLLSAAALVGVAALGTAQIQRLTLEQMVQRADNAVYGTIVDKEVIRIDHPVDGPELYYTTLFIEGTSLVDGEPLTVGVSFPGGFVDDERGVFNSEAPSADDTALGKQVVAFYKWADNMGGDFASNALYASHGGLYPTFVSRAGQIVVQGRGLGYAVCSNCTLDGLARDVRVLAAQPVPEDGK